MTTLRASLLRIMLALSLSFAIWAFVSFSQNPEETVTFPDMMITTDSLDAGLVIVDSNGLPNQALPTVNVTLRTDRQQLTALRPTDIRVVTDLKGLGPGEHIVPVSVQGTRSNVSFQPVPSGLEPAAVTIRLEQLSTQQIPVKVEVQGNLPFSFERGEPTVSRAGVSLTTVQVLGPQSRVARVTVVQATANIEQLRATYLTALSLEAIDAGGQTIEGVRLDPTTVTVQIPINPVVGLKLVPVTPIIVGLPAAGYEVRSVVVEPPLIALAGSSGPLDTIEVLTTTALDLNDARATLSRVVTVNFPAGTSPRTGEPNAVRVTVRIAPLALPFQLQLPAQITVTGMGAGLTVVANTPFVNLTVTGSTEMLAGLAQTPLPATVDVSGLGAGSYTLPVKATLPKGFRLVGDPPTVQVTLALPVATSTLPPPTESAQSTATVTSSGETPTPSASPAATPTPTPPPTTAPTPGPTATP